MTRREPVGGGSKGVALAVASTLVAFFASLPFVMIVVLYLFVSGYAIANAIASGNGEDATTIVVGFVLTISLLVLLLTATVHLIGRSLTPRRKRRARSRRRPGSIERESAT